MTVYHSPLKQHEVTVRRSLRVTSPARTIADLLCTRPRDEAVVAADSALSRRRVDGVWRPALVRREDVAAALTTRRRRVAQARTWLELADARSGSPAETVARLRIHEVGLFPEVQVEWLPPNAGRRYSDFYFPAHGLLVEVEGYAYHGTRTAHQRDAMRFNELARCPQIRKLLRFTAEDVYVRPEYVITEIRRALALLS
ncbi:endonuclease domain-containing protein [Streptomyces himalayensis]|uniref:endonuclease domain-containing protein n=1 Tax=Streptomyces himalayensis TaxID=2820085 RepID=UPI001FE2A8A3|nr:endonuclease domain-containing protein [Streptomyces himalayensis]